jgi:ATP-dependent Clp protease ATP-binding subunit ClpA
MADIKRLFTPDSATPERDDFLAPLDHEIILRVVDKFLMQIEEHLPEKKGEAHFTDAVKEYAGRPRDSTRYGRSPMAR